MLKQTMSYLAISIHLNLYQIFITDAADADAADTADAVYNNLLNKFLSGVSSQM